MPLSGGGPKEVQSELVRSDLRCVGAVVVSLPPGSFKSPLGMSVERVCTLAMFVLCHACTINRDTMKLEGKVRETHGR